MLNEDIWNWPGVLPGLSVKGFHTGDLSNEFPTRNILAIWQNLLREVVMEIYIFDEFMTNLAKFLHKYDT